MITARVELWIRIDKANIKKKSITFIYELPIVYRKIYIPNNPMERVIMRKKNYSKKISEMGFASWNRYNSLHKSLTVICTYEKTNFNIKYVFISKK